MSSICAFRASSLITEDKKVGNIICKLENEEIKCSQNEKDWNPLEWLGIYDFKMRLGLKAHLYVFITRKINETIGKYYNILYKHYYIIIRKCDSSQFYI